MEKISTDGLNNGYYFILTMYGKGYEPAEYEDGEFYVINHKGPFPLVLILDIAEPIFKQPEMKDVMYQIVKSGVEHQNRVNEEQREEESKIKDINIGTVPGEFYNLEKDWSVEQ